MIRGKQGEYYLSLQRKSPLWKKIYGCSLFICFCLFIYVLTTYSELENFSLSWKKFFLFLENTLETSYLWLSSCIYLFILLRPRYCKLDPETQTIEYQKMIGRKIIIPFTEIQSIVLDVDMSDALTFLDVEKLYRIYLKIKQKKQYLILETYQKKATLETCDELKNLLQVPVDRKQRIGWKKYSEIRLGDYTIQKEVSHGGMGKIFLAIDNNSNKEVALKVLPATCATPKNVQKFYQEINILQKLNHPNIVSIYKVGKDRTSEGKVHFYSMEFIHGITLGQWVYKSSPSVYEIIHSLWQVAIALDYIHHQKIIHLDIKPSNVMIKENGEIVIIDFGIAYDATQIIKKRIRNRYIAYYRNISDYVGTLPYMAPEQITSQRSIDHRTDIFALGVTLYEMLTLERPFQGIGDNEIMRAILKTYPPPPSKLNPNVPQDIDTITMKALEKNKQNRYNTCAAMAADMLCFLQNKPILTKPMSPFRRFLRKIFRR
ncbi:MAG TPA: serine/threonine-protein kinase [Planctomycetota bacterium]|nr:serine/threonine-protein kinase [Planctomycetota bacterium]